MPEDGHDGHVHGGHEHPGDDHAGHEHRVRASGGWRRIVGTFTTHSHDPGDAVDGQLEASSRGLRVLALSCAALAATAVLQGLVVLVSQSVSLLGETFHNLADALTAVPLAIAFTVGRRAVTRRFTYGFGRAEDIAGLAVVLVIALSLAVTAYAAIRRLIHPAAVTHLWPVAIAAVIGFAGNELVAHYRVTVGRQIGSAALVADGLHARADGLTSLAVLLGAGGAAVGWRWADPVVALVITVAIVGVLRSAGREVFARLMDAVDPALVGRIEHVVSDTPGVRRVDGVRLRWIGHSLHAQAEIAVDPSASLVDAHTIAHEAEHRLLHDLDRLTSAIVHAGPDEPNPSGHQLTAHHHQA